jgi:plastocyanin
MLRHFLAVSALLLFARVGLACQCGTSGLCTCDSGCQCGSVTAHATGQMTPPLSVVAVPADANGPTTTHIGVSDFSFSDNAQIYVGDTIEWDWLGGIHTVTSVAGSSEVFASPAQTSGSFFHTFTQTGTFWYYCTIHGFDNGNGTAAGMAATVTVMPLPTPEPGTILILFPAISAVLLRRNRRNLNSPTR